MVFNCGADFKGMSLNNNLTSGTDLANQIVGVIVKFREEPIVVMGGTESMFQQDLVPEYDCSLLRFLWWANHNNSGTVEDLEMIVHMFGAISSPTCCNSALKRTAVDNRKKYHPNVAATLLQNVYVDDLLKSVKAVQTAIRMLHNVIQMCASGGFKLMKIIVIEWRFFNQ